MPGTPGARTGLAAILTGDGATAHRITINAIRDWLEANAGIRATGLLSARPTSTPASPGIVDRRYRATDAFATFRDTGTGWELESQNPQVVAALPTGTGIPFDGQEIYLLLDAANGILAHLKYRASAPGTLKWECTGGLPLIARSDAAATAAAGNASYITAGAAPSITLPAGIGGDFDIEHGCASLANPAATSYVYQSVAVGAAAAVDADAIISASGNYETASRTVRKTAVAAGSTIAIRNRTDSASSGTWQNRWLAVHPIRVG